MAVYPAGAGTRHNPRRRRFFGRFIPLAREHAPGSTGRHFPSGLSRWRGEHLSQHWLINKVCGLSRWRGNTYGFSERPAVAAGLSAGAGNTFQHQYAERQERFIPLAREHVISGRRDRPHERFIRWRGNTQVNIYPQNGKPVYPAGAGNTWLDNVFAETWAVYPLAREHGQRPDLFLLTAVYPAGAGTLGHFERVAHSMRFIPLAREHRLCRVGSAKIPVYPAGAGTRRLRAEEQGNFRFIPAGAGTPLIYRKPTS